MAHLLGLSFGPEISGLVPRLCSRLKIERPVEREKKHSATVERGLRMTDQQLHGDDAGANDGSGPGSAGPAENRSGDRAGTDRAAVFNTILLELGAGRDAAFFADAGRRAGSAGELGVDAEPRAIGQDDGFRAQMHRSAAEGVAGGDANHGTVDLSAGGNQHLAILNHVGSDARTEPLARLTGRGGKTAEQADANGGAVAYSALGGRIGMHDIGIGI